MKRFTPVRDTQRGSQSYIKKRRGGMEIEQEERKVNSRGERQIDLHSYLFPKCSL